MDCEDYNTGKNILDLIAIIKLGTLCFAIIIILNHIILKGINPSIMTNEHIFLLCFLVTILLVIIYILWSHLYIKTWKSSNIIAIQIIENYVFEAILTILIIFSNSYASQYKYLFVFTIISTTLGLGKKQGLIIATISSFIILAIDLIFASGLVVNVYFESDLTMSSSFLIMAWVLGQYGEIERHRRNQLEIDLKEQLREHEYIKEMLVKNDSLSNLFIKNSPDAILIHTDNKILYANNNALELLGITTIEEIEEKSILNIEFTDNKKALNAKYLEIFSNKEIEISFEDTIKDKSGNKISVENTSTYCLYENKPAILTLMRDIKPVKQVQRLRKDVKKNIELLNETMEYNRFITEFFANISHELKTPLNIIFSSVQLLILLKDNSDKETAQKKEKYLYVMKQNCYRLVRLINNILDITKYDSGFIVLHLRNNDIVRVIENITMSIVSYAESKNINIVFDTQIEEKVIAFDEEKIERVILNLLSNALKFTNEGGFIYVNIMDDVDNEKVIISVKDSGIGIPDDKKEQIFNRFVQVDKTLRRNAEGTGIGLSLVKSFVELHEGTIEVKSELEKGSEFIIKLPAREIENTTCGETEIKSNISERINLEFSDIYSDVL